MSDSDRIAVLEEEIQALNDKIERLGIIMEHNFELLTRELCVAYRHLDQNLNQITDFDPDDEEYAVLKMMVGKK